MMNIPDAPRVEHRFRRGQLCINSTRPQSLYFFGKNYSDKRSHFLPEAKGKLYRRETWAAGIPVS
jgi:hypothetical protein